MITISKIKLSNFLSHEDTELSFNEFEKLLIDGKSGSGKSSIIEGVLWCLYGKGRVENRNIIRRGAKNASVALELLDDDLRYQITRKTSEKGKTGLEILLLSDNSESEVVKVEGLKEKQEWIEKTLLRSSYILFINSIIYLQDNIDIFVKQTAAKRKDILLEIANVGDYDTYYARAREEINLSSEDRARIETLVSEKNRVIDGNSSVALEVESLEKEEFTTNNFLLSSQSMLEGVKSKAEKKRSLIRDMSTHEESIKKIGELVLKNTRDTNLQRDEIKKIESVDKDTINKNVDELINIRKELSEEEAKELAIFSNHQQRTYLMSQKPTEYDYEGEINSLNKQIIEIMKDHSKQCSLDHAHCPRFDEMLRSQTSYLENQIKEKRERALAQKEALEAYVARLEALGPYIEVGTKTTELREKIKTLEPWEKEKMMLGVSDARKADLNKSIETLSFELTGLMNQTVDLNSKFGAIKRELETDYSDNYEEKELSIKGDIMSLQSKSLQITQRLTLARHARSVIEKERAELASLAEKLKEINERIESLLAIKEAFGSKGIKTLVIDHIIPRLEDKVNEILGQLSDFRIRLDTQRQSADGETMVEGLFISIFDSQNEERDFDTFSGGEKIRINTAITEGLASISSKIGFRVMDENIQALSPDMTEDFIAVLNGLQRTYPQVFVISHLREVKDSFENSIEIVKESGISRII